MFFNTLRKSSMKGLSYIHRNYQTFWSKKTWLKTVIHISTLTNCLFSFTDKCNTYILPDRLTYFFVPGYDPTLTLVNQSCTDYDAYLCLCRFTGLTTYWSPSQPPTTTLWVLTEEFRYLSINLFWLIGYDHL